MAIIVMAITSSCSKDNDPGPTPADDIDPELVGTWETKLKYQSKDLDVRLTFNEDETLEVNVKADIEEGQPPFELTASGTYKAKDGEISFQLTESTLNELVGLEDSIKYEIIVGQLYLEDLPLFPFDKVK
ncbi:MAG: hypothetical protein K2G67_06525 [Muribaculaceae bacterium]|nr:hypothetical protein [Muribaculaceae bacterium]